MDKNGVYSLCEAIVKQAFDDAEGLIKFEMSSKIHQNIPGALRGDPQVNMREIRKFFSDGLFTLLYDSDGERLLDMHLKNVRESIRNGEYQKLHRRVR